MNFHTSASLGDFPEQGAAPAHSPLSADRQISAKSLVFIDTSVPDLDQLVSGIKAAEVVLLDAGQDGLKQITALLSQRQNLDAVHILSHGSAGRIQLGKTALDAAALVAHADELTAWGKALTADADILFYGCNVAADAAGVQLIQRLSQLTGADVAASTDLTGSAAQGGDWQLEQTTGTIEAELVVDQQTQQTYSAVLPIYNGRDYVLSASNLTWEQAQAEAQRLGGNLVTINDAAEEAWLQQTFGTQGYWIGYNDRRVEGQYEWASGETSTYVNWAPGEPNNFGGDEDFGMMNFGSSRRWNDEGATKRMRGIIELNPGALPTYNGNQYRLLSSNLTWEQAQAEARQLGGNLVTINDAAEEAWLKQTFGGTEGFWIGLSDQRVEGLYEWASGEALSYTNWAPGEPNNFGGNEDFIMMNFGSSRRWNDESTGKRMRGIVEIVGATPLGSIALEQNIYSVGEAAGGVDIAIVRSGGNLNSPASIQYRADSGTATLGSDFTATQGTVSFAAGETRKVVRVPIQNDQIDEPNESFSFVIQSPTGANLGTIRTANVTIIDDDNSLLTVNPVLANESASEALITLTRGSDIGTASVDFATQDGTALVTSDYQNTTGTVSFAEGEISKTIRIAITNDSVAEPNETFQVNFSNAVNLTLSSPSVTVTLVDDDPGQFVRETVISGLNAPTAFARTPVGGPALMFIAEKSGVVKVAQNNSVDATPFINLSLEVNNVRDRGLLGIAVHPNFYNGSPYVYLAYTYDPPEAFQNTNPNTFLDDPDQYGNRPVRVVRIKADAATGFRRAVPTSDPDRQVVILGKNSNWANTSRPDGNSTTDLTIPESGRNPDGSYVEDYIKTDSESHTVGQIAFGADGALYVSIGDGTSYNAVDPRTPSVLNPDSLSGKILRVDPLTGQGFADNPFFNGNVNANRSKVWNLGLRNPFRFTIKPGTSTPFIGDVGWNSWEEVNVGTRGANFGWPGYEGSNTTSQVQNQYYNNLTEVKTFVDSNPAVTAPIYGRRHSEGARAIIMGDFYDGNTFSSVYSGALFVADVNEGTVDALTLDSQNRVTAVRRFAAGISGLVYLETGPDGNLYFININNGSIGRWRPLP